MAQLKMTLNEYINNPMGGRIMTQRGMYKQSYDDKFDKLLLRENGKIEYHLFKTNEKYVIYFKMPSESLQGLYYDVVLEFTPRDNDAKVSSDLKNYNVRFFSNDRAFIFTYAYAFKDHGLLINDFETKLGIAVKEKPETTNPQLMIGYVKEFYFAYRVIVTKGLFNKAVFTANLKSYSPASLKAKIASGQDKMDEYDKLKAAEVKHKRANKISNKGEVIQSTKVTKTTKNVSIVQKVKSMSTVKPIKKLVAKVKMTKRK